MTSLGNLTIGLGVNTDGLISGFAAARQHISGFGGIAAGILAGVGVAAVGAGIASLKMAGSFQEGMTSLVTGAGEAQKNIQMVSDGILKMSVQTATSTAQLTAGMYMVESAGYHGADGLKVLQAASEGAKVGAADLSSVANGVTTALTDYHLSASQATMVTNDLIATVASGKTHMQDLSTALSTILPTSAAVGVSLRDTSAAMATMTGEGTNAAAAATYLRQLLLALESPASKGAAALKEIGLSAQDVSDEMKKSLPATLQMITDALGKKFPVGSAAYVSALKDIAGGSRQMQGMLELTGSHLATFQQNVVGITDAVNKGGKAITGWALVQQDFNFKLAQAQQAFSVLMITLGNAFLPLATRVMSGFSSLITALAPTLERFASLFSDKLSTALALVAKWVNTYLIPDFKQLLAFFQSQTFMDFYKLLAFFLGKALQDIAVVVQGVLLPAFLQFVGLLGKLALAVGTFISHIDFSGVLDVLKTLFGVVQQVFTYITHYDFSPLLSALHTFWNTLLQIADTLKGPLEAVFQLLGPIIETAFHLAMTVATLFFTGLSALFQAAKPYIQDFADFFTGTITPAIQKVLEKVNGLLSLLGGGVGGGSDGGSGGGDGKPNKGSGGGKLGKGGLANQGVTTEQIDQLNQWDNAWWALAGAIDTVKQALGGFMSGVGMRFQAFLTNLTTGLRIWGEHLGPLMADAWKAIWPQIAPILNDLWTNIQNVFRDSAKIAGDLVFLALDTLGGNWHQFNQDMNKLGADLLDWIKDGVGGQLHVIADIAGLVGQAFAAAFLQPIIDAWNQSGLGAIFGALGGLGTFAANLFGGLAGGLVNPDKSSSDYWKNHTPPPGGLPNYPSFGGGSVGHFASGVSNFAGGLAYVHQGELLANLAPGTSVLTAAQTAAMLASGGAGGGGDIHVHTTNHVYLDGQQIAEPLGHHIVESMRRRTGVRM